MTRLGTLGPALQILFRQTANLDLLAEAIQVGREAVAAAPAGHPHRVGMMNNLANALAEWAEWTGESGMLTAAVGLRRDVLAMTGADDPDRAMYLHNLSAGLKSVFRRTTEMAVLVEAIQLERDALAATPTGHPQRAQYLNGLGTHLRMLSERTGKLPPLVEAVELGRAAVNACPTDHADRATYLADVASSLMRLFERTKEPTALTEAVEVGREVVANCPTDHRHRPLYQSNLAGILTILFNHNPDLHVITEAIELGREAVAATAPNDPHRAEYLANLGGSLEFRFRHTHERWALDEACSVLAEAAASQLAPVDMRIDIGRRLGGFAMSAGMPEAALAAFEAAVELLPQLAPRALARADRQHSFGRLIGLASEVAAAAVHAGRPARAVELLEQTRGLLLTEALDDRSGLTELRRKAPALADEFERLREQAAALADPTGEESPTRHGREIHLGERRQHLAEQWTALTNRIRATGFPEFLRPLPIDRLRHQAADGPIVLVYTSSWGANALIVTADKANPVQVVPLAGLTNEAAHQQAARLQAARAAAAGPMAGRERAQQDVHAVLGWLWDTLAGPVLDRLSITGETEPPPRIWWCPVGALAYLPIHAAGHHTDPANRSHTVLDRTVSSYLITIRALEHARTARAAPSAPAGSTVIIAMPTTPGAADLPGVRRETAELTGLLGSPLTLTGPAATHQSVTAALPQHRIAHFACHGLSDWVDPAASQLLLHDHASTPLTVTALARLQLTDPDLAYLSACSTSQTNPTLVDEAVHLTAAVHIAGYRQVIGTLWPVGDASARHIATEVYTRLTDAGRHPPRPEHTARTLTEAIRSMRDAYPAMPTRWAAHVHLGAEDFSSPPQNG